MRGTGGALLALALASVGAWGAEKGAGVSAAPILQIPIGARAVGMGTAFTAVANDVSALQYNPAGLSNLPYREAGLTFLRGLDDESIQNIAFATPLSYPGLIGNGYSSLGASLLYANHGKIEINRTNPDGSFKDSQTVTAGTDLVASLAYSERVAETVLESPRETKHVHHYLGLSAKYLRSTLVKTYTAQAAAGDVGYFARCPELGWSAGVSLLNAGTRLKYLEAEERLPMSARLGLAYQWVPAPQHALTFATDGDYRVQERDWGVNAGVEYYSFKHFSSRLGYRFREAAGGLTAGFGVHWSGIVLDYAWALTKDLAASHRITLTYRFGRVGAREREKPRRPYIENLPEREEIRELEEQRPKTFDRPRTPRSPEGHHGVPGWIY